MTPDSTFWVTSVHVPKESTDLGSKSDLSQYTAPIGNVADRSNVVTLDDLDLMFASSCDRDVCLDTPNV